MTKMGPITSLLTQGALHKIVIDELVRSSSNFSNHLTLVSTLGVIQSAIKNDWPKKAKETGVLLRGLVKSFEPRIWIGGLGALIYFKRKQYIQSSLQSTRLSAAAGDMIRWIPPVDQSDRIKESFGNGDRLKQELQNLRDLNLMTYVCMKCGNALGNMENVECEKCAAAFCEECQENGFPQHECQ
jgi:ribosomal protein L40E